MVEESSGHIGQTEGEFSVCQFYTDGMYEYVRRFVSDKEAIEAFGHYTNSVGARMGLVDRVIITNMLDQIHAEWKYGEGIIFPPEEETKH